MRCANSAFCFLFVLPALLFTVTVRAEGDCSRQWALDGIKNSSFKLVGLGISTKSDPKDARDEARKGAVQDIAMQVQSSIKSKTQVSSQTGDGASSSSFKSEVQLTSSIDSMKGLKSLKSSANEKEKITYCEVFEFNVQAAYQDLSSKLSVLEKRMQSLAPDAEEADADFDVSALVKLVKELPKLKLKIEEKQPDIALADAYKVALGAPGPSWEKKLNEALSDLESKAQDQRKKITFVLPTAGAEVSEEALAAISGQITSAGMQVASSGESLDEGALGVGVDIKSLGAARKSKTRLGLTITRKYLVQLKDAKTKKILATGKGISLSGSAADDDENHAKANAEAQLSPAVLDAIRTWLPGLIKN